MGGVTYRRPTHVPSDHILNEGFNDDRTGSRDGMFGDLFQLDLIQKSMWGFGSIILNTEIHVGRGQTMTTTSVDNGKGAY